MTLIGFIEGDGDVHDDDDDDDDDDDEDKKRISVTSLWHLFAL